MHWLDPGYLPESRHRIRQFLANGHGDVDGFISASGEQIHVPPHMGRSLVKVASAGDLIYVRGVKPRNADVLAAVSIETSDGKRFEDKGPPAKPPMEKGRTLEKHEVQGVCERVLFAPHGERVGVLLTDGTVARFDPEQADELEEFLKPGTTIAMSGGLRKTKWCTVLDADFFWRPD